MVCAVLQGGARRSRLGLPEFPGTCERGAAGGEARPSPGRRLAVGRQPTVTNDDHGRRRLPRSQWVDGLLAGRNYRGLPVVGEPVRRARLPWVKVDRDGGRRSLTSIGALGWQQHVVGLIAWTVCAREIAKGYPTDFRPFRI